MIADYEEAILHVMANDNEYHSAGYIYGALPRKVQKLWSPGSSPRAARCR